MRNFKLKRFKQYSVTSKKRIVSQSVYLISNGLTFSCIMSKYRPFKNFNSSIAVVVEHKSAKILIYAVT